MPRYHPTSYVLTCKYNIFFHNPQILCKKKEPFLKDSFFELFLSISFFKVKRLSNIHHKFLRCKVTTFFSNIKQKKTYYKTYFSTNNINPKAHHPFTYKKHNSIIIISTY
jgi:hypothetical protein